MKIFIQFLFLSSLLYSCTDSQVDLSSFGMSQNSNVQLQALNSSPSNNRSPQFRLTSMYRDSLVNRLRIFTNSSCGEGSFVQEIANAAGAILTANELAEGAHHFFYQPVFSIASGTDKRFLCLSLVTTYVVDLTKPEIPVLSYFGSDQDGEGHYKFNVNNCSSSGAIEMAFVMKKTSTPPTEPSTNWIPCALVGSYKLPVIPPGEHAIYVFFRDQAGNVSDFGSLIYRKTGLYLKGGNPNFTFPVDIEIQPISFESVGGSITKCDLIDEGASESDQIPGLLFNSETCQISGRPTDNSGLVEFKVRAKISGKNYEVSISITIGEGS